MRQNRPTCSRIVARSARPAIVLLASAAWLAGGVPGGCAEGSDTNEDSAISDSAAPSPDKGSSEDTSRFPPRDPELGSPPPWDDDMRMTLSFIRQGSFDVARERLDRQLEHQPTSGKLHFLYGLSHHREEDYAAARPYFERAVELEPDYVSTYYFYGYCLYYLGELDEALAAFDRHLRDDPDEGDSHFGRGLVLLEMGDLDEAEAAFRRAIELQEGIEGREPEVAKSYTRLSDVFVQRDEYERAREALESANEAFAYYPEAYFKLSQVHQRLGNEDQAEEMMRLYEEMQERPRPGRQRR